MDDEQTVPLVYYDEENVRHIVGTAKVNADGRVEGTLEGDYSMVPGMDTGLDYMSISLEESGMTLNPRAFSRWNVDHPYPEPKFFKEDDA